MNGRDRRAVVPMALRCRLAERRHLLDMIRAAEAGGYTPSPGALELMRSEARRAVALPGDPRARRRFALAWWAAICGSLAAATVAAAAASPRGSVLALALAFAVGMTGHRAWFSPRGDG